MKSLLMFCYVTFLVTGFLSCKSSKILSATFESDAINQPPATNLPGAPSGDVIQYNSALEPQLKVQNSATAGEKALHLSNAPVSIGSGHGRWVNFKGISTNLVNTLWFTYAATNSSPNGNVLIDLTDGAGHLIARMRIRSGGQVDLAKNITDNYTDNIGTIGGLHTVIFTTMPSTLKYNVTIFHSGGTTITAENKPMITENALQFANPAHPTISFSHASTTGDGSHHYIIESVSISRKEPN